MRRDSRVRVKMDDFGNIKAQNKIDILWDMNQLKLTTACGPGMNFDLLDTGFIDRLLDGRKAAGGVVCAVESVMAGEVRKVFCAVRPPGHHAERDRSMGFCIFNNIAIGAACAVKRHKLEKAAIVDWDLHHGNGTQNAFYDTSHVLYISLHQSPYYPGTGSTFEIGEGGGKGYTLNIPMEAGSSDDEYRGAFSNLVIPALRDFQPEILFISAGFDAHRDDPLGDMNLTTGFFGEMTRLLKIIADEFCNGRLISVLEGGYNLQALRESVTLHIEELAK